MAAPKATVWTREPHTEGKHLVFEHYLKAWIPIMASRNPRIIIVDGFTGPGEYRGGHLGSPVVAMRTLAQRTGGSQNPVESGAGAVPLGYAAFSAHFRVGA